MRVHSPIFNHLTSVISEWRLSPHDSTFFARCVIVRRFHSRFCITNKQMKGVTSRYDTQWRHCWDALTSRCDGRHVTEPIVVCDRKWEKIQFPFSICFWSKKNSVLFRFSDKRSLKKILKTKKQFQLYFIFCFETELKQNLTATTTTTTTTTTTMKLHNKAN